MLCLPLAKVGSAVLHQARLGLVNRTTCRESWGEDLITDTQLCTDPAGSVSCMVFTVGRLTQWCTHEDMGYVLNQLMVLNVQY